MALTVVDTGETEALARLLNNSATGDVAIHLYSNNVTISDASVIGDFTLITSPAAITLTGATWTIATGTANYPQQTFTFAGAATVYGYVVTNAAGTILLWAEAFTDGPYSIPAGGGTVKVTPTISAN